MDSLIWIFLLFCIVVVLSALLGKRKPKSNYSYTSFPTLLSPAERSFFGVLEKIVDDSVIVFSKVRVADTLHPQKGLKRSDWQRAFNRISGKHFDFVLCRKHDVSILCVIELNDSSHNSRKRRRRDSFLREVCDSAHLPLIEVTAQRSYNLEELKDQLAPNL